LSCLDDITELCTRNDGRDDQQSHLLRKLTGVVTRQRRALSIKTEGVISNLSYSIEKLGSGLAQEIGINPNLQSKLDASQKTIEELCLNSSERLQKEINLAVELLRDEMGKEFGSPLMADFIGSANAHLNAPDTTKTSGEFKKNVAMLNRIADTLGVGTGKSLLSASQASTTNIASGIRTVGKWVGFKFKPWQAANWSKNLANSVPYLGVALSLISLVSDVASEVAEASEEAKLREAKRDLLNHFNNVAESVGIEIRKATTGAMQEMFGQVEAMLSEMKSNHEKELGASNTTICQVALLREECDGLLKLI